MKNLRYNENLLYFDINNKMLNRDNNDKTFEWSEIRSTWCEEYDIPTFKEAISGRNIKVVDLKNNTVTELKG